MVKYSEFINQNVAYQKLKVLLEDRLNRDLTEIEDRMIRWFSNCDYEAVGVFYDLFNDLSKTTHLLQPEEVIKTLKKNEKVSIVYLNDEFFEGYVESISDNHLTIHEYVPDAFRTFIIDNIIEISRK